MYFQPVILVNFGTALKLGHIRLFPNICFLIISPLHVKASELLRASLNKSKINKYLKKCPHNKTVHWRTFSPQNYPWYTRFINPQSAGCPFYPVSDHDLCYGMSRQTQGCYVDRTAVLRDAIKRTLAISSLNVRDQISHSCKVTDRPTVSQAHHLSL